MPPNAAAQLVPETPSSTVPAHFAGYAELADAVVAPLRADVVEREGLNGPHKELRQELDELLYDCHQGLTSHAAGARARAIGDSVGAWLSARDESAESRSAEMAKVIARLGTALKSLRGDDREFFSFVDGHLGRIRDVNDRNAMQITTRQIAALVEDLAGELEAQKARSDRRVRHLSSLVRDLHSELSEVKIQLAEDPLTGLANRGTFDRRLASMLEQARLSPYQFTLVLIDLDRFKLVNDTHGHVAGDRVLKAVAEVLQRLVMRVDDLAARYGGEEMAILLDDSNGERGGRLAEEIRQTLERLVIPLRGDGLVQTASFGVAEGCESDSAESLIHRADECLYLAKKSGRNRVVVAGEGLLGRKVCLPAALGGS